ncbi:MAG: hypothetical protein O2958_08720 [Gemmatimonadetes bacterium]|nr:hypothetical protein [Gemmatimonadota bacterium]MDA1103761.1 hypothetical protein [Gemmatimonadota bacterium]
MTTRRFVMLTVASALALPLAAEANAQTPPPRPAPETELVFEREVFQYPSFTRRNPFRPLGVDDGGGPRFERLSLIGIMYSPDASSSVAVLSTGGVAVAEDGTISAIPGDSFYLKPGERIGNTTIVQIRRDAVIVDVEVFDAVERVTMNFVSRREGGTP